jgi:[protein-PII] uridylyltransferase
LHSIQNQFVAGADALAAVHGRSDAVDQAALSLFHRLFGQGPASGIALLAVGGYGRRELFPYSDVDLLFLVEKAAAASAARETIAVFLRDLWDSGMRASHSVHTPSECASLPPGNTELPISLLDRRFLAGDRTLFERLQERLPAFYAREGPALLRELGQLTRTRHAKHGHTIYHLEPHLKDAPGGLRDLHLIGWIGRLAPPAPEDSPAGLAAARLFLFAVRCQLHYLNGRDSNLLTFEHQERIAGDQAATWMREYYRHVRVVHRVASRLLEESATPQHSLFTFFRDRKARLSNADFAVARGLVYVRHPEALERDPALVLRLLEFLARHGVPAAPETERRLAQAAPAFRPEGPLWPQVAALLRLPHAYAALTTAREAGLLARLFPEYERIDCLVTADFYHRYTVDEHSLRTIQILHDLRQTQDPLQRRFAELMQEVEQPEVLLFALLLHDVGKGSGRDHVEEGMDLAEGAMERIAMPETDREMVRFLIRNHLEMSSTMTRRDLADPATAEAFAARVATLERLRKLTLLTYADIAAVNPEALTPWRQDLLWQLYVATHNQLTREMEADRIAVGPAFLQGLPTRYLRTHTPEQVQEHARLEEAFRRRGVAVGLKGRHSLYDLVVLASDRPFLFASIAGTLSSFAMNILRAEAFSNHEGMILDTFVFEDPNRSLELNPGEADRLRQTLEHVLLGKIDVRELLQKRPASTAWRRPRIARQITFDNETSSHSTLFHVITEDRPGLLYDLASTLSFNGCNIDVVLIDTEGHKAIDVFYVQSQGAKLTPERAREICQELERACEGTAE